MSGDVAVSVVLPAYNEERTLESTVAVTLETLASFLDDGTYEVIVAEDGCTDRTPEIAASLAENDPRVRHVHSDSRLGRGGALERAFLAADGDTLVYFDTDLATDMGHLEELVESVHSGEFDVATGSRWLPGHVADRPAKRGVPSRGFNFLVRTLLRSSIRDHQCGFKAFSRDALFDILETVEDDHWFWDTEVLVRAQRLGYRVNEFPVEWTPKGDTKVDLIRDVFGMGSQIVRTFWQLSVSPRITRRVTLAAGTILALFAVALMTQYLDFSTVLEGMAGADPFLVGVAAFIYVLSWPIRGSRYRDILAEIGYTERAGFLTGAIFISQTGNLVFPARAGDAVRAYVMKTRRHVPYPSGFASLAVERVFDLLTITGLAGAVFLWLAASGRAATIVSSVLGADQQSGRIAVVTAGFVGAMAVVAVLVIVMSARSDRHFARAFVKQLSHDRYADVVAGVIERFAGDVQVVATRRGAVNRIGATSVMIWAIDVVTALLVLVAFDAVTWSTNLVAVGFFAVSVGNLAKVLPITPGAIGLYEGAFSVLVVALTPLSFEVALGAAIVDHAVKNVVTIVGGVLAMVLLNVSLTTAVKETESVTESSQ